MKQEVQNVHEAPFYYVMPGSLDLRPVDGHINWTGPDTFVTEIPDVKFRVSAALRQERHHPWTMYQREITTKEAQAIVKSQSHLRSVGAVLNKTELCIMMDHD